MNSPEKYAHLISDAYTPLVTHGSAGIADTDIAQTDVLGELRIADESCIAKYTEPPAPALQPSILPKNRIDRQRLPALP